MVHRNVNSFLWIQKCTNTKVEPGMTSVNETTNSPLFVTAGSGKLAVPETDK